MFLIITDNPYLAHHGIKGQQWGIRRYQNKDGSLTPEGKLRYQSRSNVIRNRDYTDDVNGIVRSMSDRDKDLIGQTDYDADWIDKNSEYDIIANKAKTIIERIGDQPVSFAEVWTNGTRTGSMAIGTRSGDEYRGKGYATSAAEKAIKWVERYGKYTIDELEWVARQDNEASNKIAKKLGFEYDKEASDKDEGWSHYKRKVNN